MKAFLQRISSIISESEGSFDQIIHVGAGEFSEASDYEGLTYRKLYLIEGDPDVAEKLGLQFGESPQTTIVSSLITPVATQNVFHRYSLPYLNGPLPMGELRRIYPRLQEIEQFHRDGNTLGSLLGTILEDTEDQSSLLILDVPGQEAGILESLSKDAFMRFEWILLRGASESLQSGSRAISMTVSLLETQGFRATDRDESDPQWPLLLLQRDPATSRLQHQIREQEQLIINLTQERGNQDQLLEERVKQINQLGERIAELEKLVGEVSAHREALKAEVGAVCSQLKEANQQYGTLQHRISDLESEVSSKETLLDVISKGRVQQDRMYEELSEERDSLQKQIETLEAHLRDLELQIQERDEKSLLVDAEFQKVEGQMEIIKEIFLKGNALK